MTAQDKFEYPIIEQARLLVTRFERLSADSVWAHRASGMRGSLLKSLDNLEKPTNSNQAVEIERLGEFVAAGFRLLENAARELLR
jgi:hypothetical protein